MLIRMMVDDQIDGMDDTRNQSQHSQKNVDEQWHGAAIVQEHCNWRQEQCEDDLSDLCASQSHDVAI